MTKGATLVVGVVSGLLALACMAGHLACQVGWDDETDFAVPPIYVSIVVHNEESAHYHDNPQRFVEERTALVDFVNMLVDNDVKLNWQSDWTFLRAIQLHDQGYNTGGANIAQYIVDCGFEVDPHAHESQYNYADVAYLLDAIGVSPSTVAGGFIAYPPENCLLEQFWQPITSTIDPAYSWTAEVLWGGGTSNHVDEEDLWASGIWKPQDNENFMTHDGSAPIAHIGKFGNTWEDLDRLIEYQQEGELYWNHLYTATVFVRQADLTGPNFTSDFEQDLQLRKGAGNLEWVGLGELFGIWENDYNSNATQLFY